MIFIAIIQQYSYYKCIFFSNQSFILIFIIIFVA